MMRFSFVTILCLFIICSCKETNKYTNTEQEVITLTSTNMKINESDIIMKFPREIFFEDSILYIIDSRAIEFFIHSFKYPSMEYLQSFGKVGDGPYEYNSLGGFLIDTCCAYLFETNKARLDIYNKKNWHLVKSIEYPREIAPILSTTKYESGFLSIDYSGENRLIILNEDGNIAEKKYNIINSNAEVNSLAPQMLAVLHTASIDYNSKNKTAAIASQLGNVLELYYFRNEIEQKIIIGKEGYPGLYKVGNGSVLGKIEGYFDVQICNDKIYTLFSGRTREEEYDMVKKGLSSPNGGNKILVYNMEGDIIKRYELDRYIYGFWIDEEIKKIFAVDNNNDDQIYYFDLPD